MEALDLALKNQQTIRRLSSIETNFRILQQLKSELVRFPAAVAHHDALGTAPVPYHLTATCIVLSCLGICVASLALL